MKPIRNTMKPTTNQPEGATPETGAIIAIVDNANKSAIQLESSWGIPKIVISKLAKLERERDALRAELRKGAPRVSTTGDKSTLAEFLSCESCCVDQYPDGTMVVIVRAGGKEYVYSTQEAMAELRKAIGAEMITSINTSK